MLNYLIVFFWSMVPLVELRGAIPIAYYIKENNDPTFNIYLAYLVIAIGNMLPVPFIFFFARKVLEWGKDKPIIGGFFTFCLEKGEKGGKKLTAKAGRGLFLALLLFVGIPLPGTGAWTGTLAASILDMDFKSSVLAVILGVALAGIIMTVASLLGVSILT
ncbi:MAG: small multi-drug export protein [Butyrivibrio sp.]|nr:small multi-drug export protein [Butyrivibrio sp.]